MKRTTTAPDAVLAPNASDAFEALGATTLLSPVPAVLVSCRAHDQDTPNILTVAWAGTVCTKPPMLSISVRPERFSYEKIIKSGEFCVNLPSQALARATDFCGVKSGREVNKFESCGLTPLYLDALLIAPAIAQAPVVLACRVAQVIPLGSHTMILANIVQTYVQKRLIGEGGSLCLDRAQLIAYRHGQYVALGKPLGFFGYSLASPEVLRRRMGSGGAYKARPKTRQRQHPKGGGTK